LVFRHKEKNGKSLFRLEKGEIIGWNTPQKTLTAQRLIYQQGEEKQLYCRLKRQVKL
jgi:hypothetical protein